jgi:hypothetical protein
MDLVPIKVKIELQEKGRAKYPDFNSLPGGIRNNMDWSEYIDAYGSGWLYDCCGHKEEQMDGDEWDSPLGQQWGVILVPKNFADGAVIAFPNECEKIDDARCQVFYDTRHARDFPEENVNEEALKQFEVKERLGVTLTPEEETRKAKALDPNDPEPGIKKNERKTWAGYKNLTGTKIVL